MRDKEIVGLYQAYLDVYSNSNEEVEQLDEDFPKQVGDFLKRGGDELKKRLPGVAKVLSPVGPGQGTVTASQQKAQIKPVGEEVEQLDELSSEVRARAKHKRMQNLDAAQRREMDARNVGATMGEISKRAEETSDASAKFSKHNQLSSRHARSRKRMNKEEVENWVNSLIEEGYDLSEYTWDDMYEMYVTEGRYTSLSALSRESQKRKEDKERGRPETQAEIHGRLAMGDFSPGASQKERARGGRQRLKDRGKVPQKGGKDMFEHILEHLVAEGYADTNESALAIMANMSEEWRQSIVEGATGAFVPSRVDDFNNRRDMLKNRYGQDVGPRIPGPSGGGQYGEPPAPKAGVLKLARGTSSLKRGVESKNNA